MVREKKSSVGWTKRRKELLKVAKAFSPFVFLLMGFVVETKIEIAKNNWETRK